jgi:hypothetical protein
MYLKPTSSDQMIPPRCLVRKSGEGIAETNQIQVDADTLCAKL